MDMTHTYEELRKASQNLLKENTALKEEIQRLKGLNIGKSVECKSLFSQEQLEVTLSLEGKVALFRSLFRGHEDVFARRWFSRASEKSGYQPVCLNEWNRAYCDKKRFKCAECPHPQFKPRWKNYRPLAKQRLGKSQRYNQSPDLIFPER